MKYFYFILLILLTIFFFIFANLNPNIIVLDLFFLKIEGISIGFSMIFAVLLGVVISLTSVWIAILIVSAFIDRDIDLVFMIKSSLVVFLFFYILMLVIKIGVY